MKEKIIKYFEDHRDEMLKDIGELISVNSVKGEALEGKPFGEGPAAAVAAAEKICKRLGFKTTNFENYVLTVNHMDSPAHLGILCHLDVVAEGTGWTKEPFKMVEENGKIYGRGVSDDKGPAIVALYALKAIDDLKIPVTKNTRIILGADEECGSSDLKYYFKKEAPPTYCISPDAEYPVFNVEKGGYKTDLRASYDVNGALPRLNYLKGGHTANIVAQHASALVEGFKLPLVNDFCKKYSEITGADISAVEKGHEIVIECEGKSSHASMPQDGNNALTAILAMLSAMPFAESELKGYIDGLTEIFPHGDFLGKAAGIAARDDIAGELTCSFDILNICDGKVDGVFDIRSPICCNESNTSNVLAAKLLSAGLKVDDTTMNPPHHVSADLPFIKTLLSAYENYTGLKGGCCSMGGGTYVHHIENGVAFGPTFQGTETNLHGADEFAVIDELIKTAEIYTEVIAEMCK
ncbi:MAG: Sapep family Mn(2+)-dependent dipeptidase [Oscillospiraceae bacterium]